MTSVADLRSETHYSEECHLLLVEGIPTAWTDDESGALLGSGGSTWMGKSETDLIAEGATNEVLGFRQIKAGLVVPASVQFGMSPKELWPDDSSVRFRILDLDDTLVSLFATVGKDSDTLSEYIPASTTALGSTIRINDDQLGAGGQAVDPADKYIGIELIGPSRQRGMAYPIPNAGMPGHEHLWNGYTPPELVSDDPIVWEGRRWALYRLHRDHHTDMEVGTTAAGAWPVWRLQHEAGGLVAWGVLSGGGRHAGDKVWEIEGRGHSALLKKPLGIPTNIDWTEVSAPPSLSTTAGQREDLVAIIPRGYEKYGGGKVFDASIFDTAEALTSTNFVTLRDEINALCFSVWDEQTATNYDGANGSLETVVDATGFAGMDLKYENGFQLRMDSGGVWLEVKVIMHRKAWYWLGYVPEEQHSDVSENDRHVRFAEMQAGDNPTYLRGNAVPGPGYVEATFTTQRIGTENHHHDNDDLTNEGAYRVYRPKYDRGLEIISLTGNQWLGIGDGTGVPKYCQGNTLCRWSGVSSPGGEGTTNRAGLFCLRGEIARAVEGEDKPEKTEIHVPFVGEWLNSLWSTSGGTKDDGVIDSTDGNDVPVVYIRKFLNPRLLGFDNDGLDVDWWSNRLSDKPVEIRPMSGPVYLDTVGTSPTGPLIEWADAVLASTMLSTGSATGYDGAISTAPTFDKGDNDPGNTGQYAFHADNMNAGLGLAIPKDLVQGAVAMREAFASILPDGAADELNRIRIAWFGTLQAEEMLQSITQPRRLALGLDGRQYGVFGFAPFSANQADYAIGEGDLSGSAGEPTSVIPSQEMQVTGSIDRVEMAYRYDPAKENTRLEHRGNAQDANASTRTGDRVHKIKDYGLPPLGLGLGAWTDAWRKLWLLDDGACGFYAKSHFAVTSLRVRRELGQDLFPGSKVRITNPWLVDPSGSYGVTNHPGVVLEADHELDGVATVVKVLLFAEGGLTFFPHYAPVAKMNRWDSGTNIAYTLEDFRQINDPNINDLTGFSKPSWATGAGAGMVVRAYYWDGQTDALGSPVLTKGPTNTIQSVDTAGRTITMTGAWSSTMRRDWDVFIVPEAYDSQVAWAQEIYGFVVLANGKGGSVPTKGKKFL